MVKVKTKIPVLLRRSSSGETLLKSGDLLMAPRVLPWVTAACLAPSPRFIPPRAPVLLPNQQLRFLGSLLEWQIPGRRGPSHSWEIRAWMPVPSAASGRMDAGAVGRDAVVTVAVTLAIPCVPLWMESKTPSQRNVRAAIASLFLSLGVRSSKAQSFPWIQG